MRILIYLLAAWFITPSIACAASPLIYVHDHHIVTVRASDIQRWRTPLPVWTYRGVPAALPRHLSGASLPPSWQKTIALQWDRDAIRSSLHQQVQTVLHRDVGSVVIRRTASGTIIFDGVGFPGRDVLMDELIDMTMTALDHGISTIVIPVKETPPVITIEDRTLKALGINEVVMVGESDFAGSPKNRDHNIRVGAAKFNGYLIPNGEIFSFNTVLGPVNEKTGFKKELVIQEDRTLPDYGGGLCQVSSTAYRGPWEYGLPILKRRNHSYAVRYYSPQGTDATIYPPNVDLRFRNDTSGALLIQTFIDDKQRLSFIYYGTRDKRASEVFGPFISNRTQAPTTEKVLLSADLPPGQKRKAGEAHDGLDALWFRRLQYEGSGTTLQQFFSSYEARPLTWEVGATKEDIAAQKDAARSGVPSWLSTRSSTSSGSSAAYIAD